MEDLKPFWYWINERHMMWKKRFKDKLPAPWTKDPILAGYRFCNVFRELDVVTKWLRTNWYNPNKNDPNLWFAAAVARQINRVDTLKMIGYPYGDLKGWLKSARSLLEMMDDKDEQIYGSAYIITAGGVSGAKWMYTCDYVLADMVNSKVCPNYKRDWSLEQLWNWYRQYEGAGPFIAYEIVTDLRWTRYYSGSDHMTWANAGPGAKRGIARLFYGDLGPSISPQECLEKMRYLLKISPKHIGSHVPPLEMRDIEHSLCETDKYLRAKTGEGRPKKKYVATT